MLFKSLLLASTNRGKYEEFLKLLPEGAAGEFLFAAQLGAISIDVEETGTTYAENAVLKARAWAAVSGLPSLADDSGIEAAALSWRPGIYSARAVEGSDEDRNRWLLSQMQDREDRRARFVAAVALSLPGRWTLVCEGVCDGTLAREGKGRHGFGYDPLFIPEGHDISFAELPPDLKNEISHRARAVRLLFQKLALHSKAN